MGERSGHEMNDRERLIDTLDEIFAEVFIADGSETERVLAALRAEGYDLYRPDDCEKVEVEDGGEYADYQTGERKRAEPILRGRMVQDTRCMLRVGEYRLVPVGGEG